MRVLSRIALSLLTAGALIAPVATVPASAVAPTAAVAFVQDVATPQRLAMKSGTQLAAISNLEKPFTLSRVNPDGTVSEVETRVLFTSPQFFTVGSLTPTPQPVTYYLAPSGVVGTQAPSPTDLRVLTIIAV